MQHPWFSKELDEEPSLTMRKINGDNSQTVSELVSPVHFSNKYENNQDFPLSEVQEFDTTKVELKTTAEQNSSILNSPTHQEGVTSGGLILTSKEQAVIKIRKKWKKIIDETVKKQD
jgi:hypothetical protein